MRIGSWDLQRFDGGRPIPAVAGSAYELVRTHERADLSYDRDRDREAQIDDAAAWGDQRGDAHQVPAEPVREHDDELPRVQPGDEPDGQQDRVDRRVHE